MPRFKQLDRHVREAMVAILRQRLGSREVIVAWLNRNDENRTPGEWLSVCAHIEPGKTVWDSDTQTE